MKKTFCLLVLIVSIFFGSLPLAEASAYPLVQVWRMWNGQWGNGTNDHIIVEDWER